MADVQIDHEQDVEGGWCFAVRIAGDRRSDDVRVILTMSWADYDHWSSGTEAPSALAREVIEFVLSQRAAADLPPRFDAATVRRWMPEIDSVLGRAR